MATTAVYTNGTWTSVTKYPVARVSKVKDDAHIYDILDTANAINQGANIKLGDHVSGELQVRTATTPSVGDKLVFVCDVPLLYDDHTRLAQAEYNYFNKAGKITKAYEMEENDVFGVSDYAITPIDSSTPVAIGQLIVTNGSRGWKALASTATTTSYGFVGKVIGFEKYSYDTVVLFEVVRNEAV